MRGVDKEQWLSLLGSWQDYNFFSRYGFYDTALSGIISAFLKEEKKNRLLHVNKDAGDRYAVTLVKRH